uniref:Sine oculis-binding protein homolog n=1 Tax=Knipowitschia caucasica TaxID=637954 RepID=A0AAV2K778_KNICA
MAKYCFFHYYQNYCYDHCGSPHQGRRGLDPPRSLRSSAWTMPEMEKGRPAENKRSRKPAHPVKRELNHEMKTFAESTMNELLGWYGYDKVELRESEANEIRNYRERRQHVSVLKENSVPKAKESKACAPPTMNGADRDVSSVPVSSSSTSSSSSSSSSSISVPKEPSSAPVIVPLIKPSAVEEAHAVQIVCVWCQKEGVKRYSLCMGSELKSFCSEKCFAACRRAYFKRNKARDEDLQSERSPQPPLTDDSTRLVLKTNSSVRACDWCKHVRYTKEYLDFGAGEERLQFCSTKCLNQYKMDVFYREARAALSTSSNAKSDPESSPSREGHSSEGKNGTPQKLLTPESWTGSNGETKHRKLSPKITNESSLEAKPSGSRTLDRTPQTQTPVHPATITATPHPSPVPHLPPRHMVDHPHPHGPPIQASFIRPPLHAQGLKSPLTHPMRHPGPPSSPIHRHPHSPHLQPPMNPPGLMHPFPGAYFPGLHSPPMNMMPRLPVPSVPPMPPAQGQGQPKDTSYGAPCWWGHGAGAEEEVSTSTGAKQVKRMEIPCAMNGSARESSPQWPSSCTAPPLCLWISRAQTPCPGPKRASGRDSSETH